ncbi:ABC transporter ATP-binding protein [Nonomuraea angiospora]|uniref:Peptide/nickel transport system ATP-binding protein n=1 Tax=Nonomuraea angiospora TaxID=46172 RepID=A0ABR9LQ44_9ACTN|nr:ATP-binding cassette domain-containing protein [Nonomuraea angiospora]MBE1582737.1 peptide/nickel transport system ATP-binding protein [Nonomuraea angiospora]
MTVQQTHHANEPRATGTAVVEATGLRKTFRLDHREFVAVDNVSFDVLRGECLGLVGESGSGKTTVAKLLLGIERPDAGRITVNGRPRDHGVTKARERRRRARETQIVFQDPYTSLDPRQSAHQAVMEVLRLHFGELSGARREKRAGELLDSVGLDTRRRHALPINLSGGQRQRIGIARALAAEPDVIILDEAVSGLDVSIQAQVLNLLADLQAETGMSYIFISHDLSVIRQLADRVIVMRDGTIVERGQTAKVFDDPQHPYTQMLRAAAPRPGWRPERRAAESRPQAT